MGAVIVADAAAEFAIGLVRAEGFDPRVFVRRNGLLRELAADPVGSLGQDDRLSRFQRRQARRATSQAAADDDQIGMYFPRLLRPFRAP